MKFFRSLAALVLGAAALSVPPAIATPPQPSMVRLSDLPIWQGNPKELLWLTPSVFPNSEPGAPPNIRLGAIRTDAKMHTYLLDSARPGEPLPLPGGWEVEAPAQTNCRIYSLKLRRPADDKRAEWIVRLDRHAGILSRHLPLSCIAGDAKVFYGVLVNSRYFAFETMDPGWIFFDRQNGEFLPLLVESERNITSQLYVDRKGQVLIEAPGADQKAAGVRQVLSLGRPLIAPWQAAELKEVERINRISQCRLRAKHGRPCEDATTSSSGSQKQ